MNTTGKMLRLHSTDPFFEDVVQIDQVDFPRPWSRSDWLSLDLNFHHLLALQGPLGIQGFCLFSILPGDDSAHLLKICLRKELRSTGLAMEFWAEILYYLREQLVQSVYLEVDADNTAAIQFYSKVCFQRLRFIRGYYSDGKDALTMLLTLQVENL